MSVIDQSIKKLDEVWSTDQKLLGLAQTLHVREEGVDPELQLFGAYLQVENYDLGEIFYVPTDFITSRIDANKKIVVSATFTEALRKTWTRMPDFVAQGNGQKVDLPKD